MFQVHYYTLFMLYSNDHPENERKSTEEKNAINANSISSKRSFDKFKNFKWIRRKHKKISLKKKDDDDDENNMVWNKAAHWWRMCNLSKKRN